jgi:hypothetical protein
MPFWLVYIETPSFVIHISKHHHHHHYLLRNEKALDEFLTDPQVEGVYESMTPLWFRAVLKLGMYIHIYVNIYIYIWWYLVKWNYNKAVCDKSTLYLHIYMYEYVYIYMLYIFVYHTYLGCIARPMFSAQSSNVGGERVFKLKDLDFINSAAHPYLQVWSFFIFFMGGMFG